MEKPWLLLPLACLVAVPARLWSESRAAGPAPPEASYPDPIHPDPGASGSVQALQRELDARVDALASLSAQLELLEQRSSRWTPAPAAAPEPSHDPEEIAAAVQAWLQKQALSEAVLVELEQPADAEPGSPIARLPLEQLIAQAMLLPAFAPEAEAIYQELRASGRMQELIEGLEARVQADPNNPELRVTLGIAYLEQLFGLEGTSMQAGRLAMGADRSFDRALELDPSNVKGRFSKAVALSNWPQFMGKTGEALAQFQTLVEQMETGQIAEPFSMPYLFMGNMYLRTGDRERARDAWQRGLERFPGDAALEAQLAAETGRKD